MQYISVAEAAAKWDVTPRQVQRLLAAGRIPGARKFGRSWQIPAGSPKPADPRRDESPPVRNGLSSELGHIIATINAPAPRDNPYAVLEDLDDAGLRLIHEGGLAYAQGDFGTTVHCYRQLEGEAPRLFASSVTIAAAISAGDYELYMEIEQLLKQVAQANREDVDISTFAELSLSGGYLGAMAPNMVPGWLKNGDFSALLPQSLPDAAYKRAKYFQCIGDYTSMLAVAQTALSFCHSERELTFPATYLTLMCAAACYALGREGEAERWLLEAMELNLPHGFITPFAETLPLFGGMMERLLGRESPARYGAIIAQQQRTFTNWISFHNRFTKDNITLILTLREYELARLVSQRIPYAKIAKQHHISISRLKSIMEVVYDKLFVNSREELAKFIL